MFILYLIKSSLLLAISVPLFTILLSDETFHRLNRVVLLAVMGLSLVMPLCDYAIDSPMARFSQAMENILGLNVGQSTVDMPVAEVETVGIIPMSDKETVPEVVSRWCRRVESLEGNGGR